VPSEISVNKAEKNAAIVNQASDNAVATLPVRSAGSISESGREQKKSGQSKTGKILALISAASLCYLFIRLYVSNPQYFPLEVLFAAEMLIITTFTRTVTLYDALRFFTKGILISMVLTLVIGRGVFGVLLGMNTGAAPFSPWIAPPLEEIAKILPVALAAALVYRRRKWTFNLSDWLLLGAMCGAGFSSVEKACWHNVHFSFIYGPHAGGLYLCPDALGVSLGRIGAMGYVGHGAAAGMIAVAIGLGFYLKERKVTGFWWLIPASVFGWVTLEHCLLNLFYAERSTALLSIGGGMLTPWLFLITVAFALAFDAVSLFRVVSSSYLLRAGWKSIMKRRSCCSGREPGAGTAAFIRWLGTVLSYLRYNNQVGCLHSLKSH
jgi:RsiW-degrading membrane proteinase PrsW (M82 family)